MMTMEKEAPSAGVMMSSATASAVTADGDGGGDDDTALASKAGTGPMFSDSARTGGNPLLRAVQLGRLRLTRLLLDGGAYINESNDHGETPLMVACLTQHTDTQSASKARMVRYLIEKNADPNIQDKCGRTALMHACRSRAGAEVAVALLQGGAEPSLEDRSGRSALVYAIHADEPSTLKVLLDACKAKGKEVIIINMTEKPSLPNNKLASQYLSLPKLPEPPAHQDLPSCASPSDIELSTSPSTTRLSASGDMEPRLIPAEDSEAAVTAASTAAVTPVAPPPSSSRDADPLFSFARGAGAAPTHAGGARAVAAGSAIVEETPSPSRRKAVPPCRRGGGSAGRLSQLKRLQSEPCGLVAPSVLAKADDGDDGGVDQRSAEGRTSDAARSAGSHASNGHSPRAARHKRPLSRQQSMDVIVSAATVAPPPPQQHLGRRNTTPIDSEETQAGTGGAGSSGAHKHERVSPCALPPHTTLGASLRDMVHRRHLGADPHEHEAEALAMAAAPAADSARFLLERRKHNTSPLTLLMGSRESLHADSTSPLLLRRHQQHPPLERRGSGTLLLDRISQTRPGFLPPLNINPHPPIPDIGGNAIGSSSSIGGSSGNIFSGSFCTVGGSSSGSNSNIYGSARASAGRTSSLVPGMAAHASLCLPARPVGLSLVSSASASSLSQLPTTVTAPHCSPRRGDAGATPAEGVAGFLVTAPRQPKRPLVRRHSMQVEQMKQLGGFEGFCAK